MTIAGSMSLPVQVSHEAIPNSAVAQGSLFPYQACAYADPNPLPMEDYIRFVLLTSPVVHASATSLMPRHVEAVQKKGERLDIRV